MVHPTIANKLMEAKQALASYGAIAEEPESVPWEVVYPDFNGSVALRGARKREALTQKELARLVGISQTHVSEMEHGKRPIGKEMAKRLAKALKVNYRVFL
jgi:DNA-binding XRE family transcriptional regulator